MILFKDVDSVDAPKYLHGWWNDSPTTSVSCIIKLITKVKYFISKISLN